MEQATQAQNEIISSEEVAKSAEVPLVAATTVASAAAVSPARYSLVCDNSIVQPANDERTYKMIRLFENKLEILLVYDSEEGKSAAAVNVNAGYLQDPLHRQGLAHFLEHMLFLGTEKFPNADFDEFLNENAGFSNAYTDYMETNYYFQCAGTAFREGLDRFASFFVAPLFNEDLVNREMNAVNSEHSNNLQDDENRISQLLDSSAIPESPMTKFGTGNLETLQHEQTRADLIEFYKEHYSSNLMKVCIVTHEPLHEIEPYIVGLFEKIPNKDKPAPSYAEKPFPNENFAALWKYTPIKNENSIEVAWTTDYFSETSYHKHPLSYWTHIFGFEGENSLLSALKALGYAEGLSSGDTDVMKNSSIFYINIELTNEGLTNYMHVLDVTFAFVKAMKSFGAQEYIFNEERISGMQSFNSQDQEEPMDYAHRLTANMQLLAPIDVLKGHSYCEEYDPVLLNSTISSFTAQNMRIFLKSQSCEPECTQVEKYYGSKYVKLPLPQEILDIFENPKYDVNGDAAAGTKKIGLPPKNPFICAGLTLVDVPESELAHSFPRVIKDDEKSTVYFKQDTKYKVSKTLVNVIIHSNDGDRRDNCENQLLSVLWHKLFKESTREFEYQAEMAKIYSKLRFKISTEVLFEGFSSSVQAFVTEYMTRLSKFDPSTMENEFRVQLDQMSKKLHNFSKRQPYEQAKKLNFYALKWQGAFSISDQVKSIEGISFEKLLAFHAIWFKNIRMNWIIAGNIQEETARQFIQSLEDILFTNRAPLPKEAVYVPVSVSLKSSENSDFVFESKLDSEEKNSYISSVFEFEHVSLHHDMLLKLIDTFLEEPFYSSLRTEQQLGYIVWSYAFSERTKHFYQFQVQSDKKSPQYLQNQIKEFIDEMAKEVDEMGDEDFDVLKKSVDLEPAHSLSQQISRFWLQIQNRRLMFDFHERQLEELEAITLEQFKAAFDAVFFEKRANLQLHLISSVHQDENDKLKGEKEWEDDGAEDEEDAKEETDKENEKEKKSQFMNRYEDKFIQDISAFKVSQPKNQFLYLSK